ncbi:PglD-related sugar-binding protein [Prevotella bivia]|uniref:PglD-related sugar-binding protein n=1 Tax=Prevotella bivia TaxID=28125 RepID=UPI002889AE62|nr:serine acetyltransferase [Prevotella bivia]
MKDIAIFGAGRFGREVACLIEWINSSLTDESERWNLVGYFADGATIGEKNEYGSLLGGRDELNRWPTQLGLVIAIGIPNAVKSIAESIVNPNVFFPNLIAPNVLFLDKNNYKMGKGNIICTNCMVSCNVTIGNFNIFNGYIPIGHDTVIGNYNVIMPSVNISGSVTIGECNFFGVKSAVLEDMKIGNNTRIGANSVIMRKTKDGFLYIGNPAKRTKL